MTNKSKKHFESSEADATVPTPLRLPTPQWHFSQRLEFIRISSNFTWSTSFIGGSRCWCMMSLHIVCCHVPSSALIPTYSNQFSKSALALKDIKCRHGTICSWPLHGGRFQSTLSSFCWQVCILGVRFQNDSVMPTNCSPSFSQSSVGSWSFTLLPLATRTWPSQLLEHAALLVKTFYNLVYLLGGISSDQVVLPPPWLGRPAESLKSLVMPANWLLVWLRCFCCLCIHHTVDVHCLQESSDCFAGTSPWWRILQRLLLLIGKQHEMERQLRRRDGTWAKMASDENESQLWVPRQVAASLHPKFVYLQNGWSFHSCVIAVPWCRAHASRAAVATKFQFLQVM